MCFHKTPSCVRSLKRIEAKQSMPSYHRRVQLKLATERNWTRRGILRCLKSNNPFVKNLWPSQEMIRKNTKYLIFYFSGPKNTHSLWDLSSLTRDRMQGPPVGAPGPDPWAPGAPWRWFALNENRGGVGTGAAAALARGVQCFGCKHLSQSPAGATAPLLSLDGRLRKTCLLVEVD